MKIPILLSLLLLGLNVQGSAQTIDTSRQSMGVQQAQVFSLQQCLTYAYENQDSIKNAKLDVKIATETVRETVGRGLPNISLTAGILKNVILSKQLLPGQFFGKPAGTFVPITFGVPYQANYLGQVTQLLFDASYLVGLKAAAVVKDLSVKSLSRTKIQIKVQVTKAYYNVLASQERIKLTESALSRIAKNLSDTRAMNKAGFAELIDVQRSEVQYNNAQTDRKQSVNGLMAALFALKFQIGMPLENSLNVSGTVKDVNLQQLADTTSLPYEGRIEYSLLQTQLEANRLMWTNAKAGLLPKLSAYGNYGKNWFSTNLGDIFKIGYPGSMIGLSLTWNIFDGGQTIHRINENRFTYQKSKNNLDNAKKGIQLQVQSTRLGYMNDLLAVENQERNRQLAQNVYTSAKIKYTEGIGSNLELSDAEISLKDAETNYINSLLNVLISKVDLDAALGNFKP